MVAVRSKYKTKLKKILKKSKPKKPEPGDGNEYMYQKHMRELKQSRASKPWDFGSN